MEIYKITPLHVGTVFRKYSHMSYGSENEAITPFPLSVLYLESEHHRVMIDTGGIEPDGEHWEPYIRKPEERVDAKLKEISVDPGSIDTVILTHLHWDHASNNALFPNAVFYVQKKEYDFTASESNHRIKPFLRELLLKTEYKLVDGNQTIIDGIEAVPTPGHTPGSQSLIIRTEKGKVLFAGDLIPLLSNWEQTPKTPGGVLDNLEDARNSLELLSHYGVVQVLPSHDFALFGGYAQSDGTDQGIIP
ncbi:MAG: N-acyl homoserine lactonase family protein [Oscillospiraceae bacterium]|nr:N-acyl homoserine lactonase family protein [Oscillospiraceae bacterium]MBR6208690.1 N-acyl homoserine lactonase family protein [Oscillospiraceae bacterium]